ERKEMICRDHDLSISRQASLLGISRGSVYYKAAAVSDQDLDMMRRMDALHLEHPWMGSRMLRDMLLRQGFHVGRKHMTTLMRRMDITAQYRKRSTSKRHPGHKVYPYLLRGLNIDHADKVWAMDITYIPMNRGFVYLCELVDWASLRVVTHWVSVTMDVSFCIEALEEAFSKYGKLEY